MKTISGDSTLLEVAAIVSAALEEAGLKSVLSGGAAISIYTENRYESVELFRRLPHPTKSVSY